MADQEFTTFDIKGLNTAPNPFSKAPPGTLAQADNCVLKASGLLEPRRGNDVYASLASAADIVQLASYRDHMLAFSSNGYVYDSAGGALNPFLIRTGLGAFSTTSPSVTMNGVNYARQNRSLYWTTASGVQKLEGSDASGDTVVREAGAPEPLLVTLSTITTGVSGSDWLPVSYAVAYRVVVGRYDDNNYLLLSTPSSRLVVTNTLGGTATPTLKVFLPASVDATSNWFVQVYRGAAASQTVSTDPSDEMFQCQEIPLNSTGVSAGYITIQDANTANDPSRPLYTNANTGDGIEASNDLPPLAADICAYRSRLLYVNTNRKGGVEMDILGIGAPNGLQAGDYLLISSGGQSVQFTADNFVSITNYSGGGYKPYFNRVAVGTVGQQIEGTARSLCEAITSFYQSVNGPLFDAAAIARPSYTSGLRATYIGDSLSPGKIYVECLNFDQSAQLIVNRYSAWAQGMTQLLTASPTATSDDPKPAGVYWSNDGLPESVSLDSWALVGDPSKPILRVAPLGQSAFFLKSKGDGTWMLTGTDPSTFDIRLFDSTLNLSAPRCVAALGGVMYILTAKGVEAFSEAGRASQPVSEAIDRELAVLRLANPNFDTLAFMTAYESEGLLILAVPSSTSSTACDIQYVFTPDEGWTRWLVPAMSAAAVGDTGDKLHTSRITPGALTLRRERKAYLSSDYSDDGAAISCTFALNPISPGTPALTQSFRDVYWSWRWLEPASATSTLSTDRAASTSTKTLVAPAGQPWGNFAWGNAPWGAQVQYVTTQHGIPANASTGVLLNASVTLGEAGKFWQLQGIAVLWEPSTTASRST